MRYVVQMWGRLVQLILSLLRHTHTGRRPPLDDDLCMRTQLATTNQPALLYLAPQYGPRDTPTTYSTGHEIQIERSSTHKRPTREFSCAVAQNRIHDSNRPRTH